jgi:hypothetical protein
MKLCRRWYVIMANFEVLQNLKITHHEKVPFDFYPIICPFYNK